MVTRTLVDRNIEGGRRLLEILDACAIQICAALWFYLMEEDEWRLLLATKIVDNQGPLAAYEFVRKALEEAAPISGPAPEGSGSSGKRAQGPP